MVLEGKSQQAIDEAIRKQQQYGILGNKQENPYSDAGGASGADDSSYSLVSIVYNYFNDTNDCGYGTSWVE